MGCPTDLNLFSPKVFVKWKNILGVLHKVKIGIYICSNGYGHFHRMLQVCTNLPFHEIDIHCEKISIQ